MIPVANRNAQSSNIDFSAVKNDSQKCLFSLLDNFEGTKSIIWDDDLIGAFEFVARASTLRQHDTSRLFRLSDVKLKVFSEIKTDFILFFIRKDYNVAKSIANILNRSDRASLAKTSLVFVPYRCASIEKFLEQNKVDLGKLNSVEELKIDLYVLDSDLISTENEYVFRDLYLNGDHSFAHQITMGLIKLQDFYGQIPKVSGQGKAAKLVCDLLLKHRKLHSRQQQPTSGRRQPATIHQLILIDRRIDLVTPLLTQLTYEGLLDEVFGVSHGTITLPAERFAQFDESQGQSSPPPKPTEKTKETKRFELRSSEDLFARLRDCHINGVADVLKQSARNLQAEYEECNCQRKTIAEIGKIVKRLNHLKIAKKSQSNHVTIAELVNEQTLRPEFIYGLRIEHELLQEDRLNRVIPEIDTKLLRQEPALHVLRLICLQSIISNGFKSKIGDYYKREIIQNYGPSFIPFILQLEKANIFMSQERDSAFNQLKSKLNLVKDDVDECNPRDLSYVYGGYSPISIMVAKILALPNQSRSMYDHLRLLPEPTINHVETNTHLPPTPLLGPVNGGSITPVSDTYSNSLTNNAISAASMLLSASGIAGGVGGPSLRVRRNSTTSSQSSSEETRTILVFFIGGCTFAEISALRFLSQQEEINCEFLIGTTKIINGGSFLESMWPLNKRLPQL